MADTHMAELFGGLADGAFVCIEGDYYVLGENPDPRTVAECVARGHATPMRTVLHRYRWDGKPRVPRRFDYVGAG